jgi:hypothetical protein
MLLFLIAATRAIIEMLGLCLIGMALMRILAGSRYATNPIYRLFELITRAPRNLLARLLPGKPGGLSVGVLCFVLLFALWIGLAAWRSTLV